MLDIKSLLGDIGVPFWESGKNVSHGWTTITCPVPGCGDRSNHGGFSPDGNAYTCFKCGKHSVKYVISCLTDWDTAGRLISEYSDIFKYNTNTHRERASSVKWPPPGTVESFPSIHAEYLKNRGYDVRQLREAFGIKATYYTGDFKYRIVVPIYQNGILVTYVGRDVTGKAPLKYKNLAERKSVLPAKECVYNIDNIDDTAIICEGIFDAWRFGMYGVAVLGLQFTATQINTLAKKLKRGIICFDSEPTAQRKAEELAESLALQGVDVEILLIDQHDPGEMSQKEADEVKKALLTDN
jgi:hypothetical protein